MHFILPLSKGWQIGAMSEETFRNRPLLWLELMSIHGTQYTFAPDFAYSLVRYMDGGLHTRYWFYYCLARVSLIIMHCFTLVL